MDPSSSRREQELLAATQELDFGNQSCFCLFIEIKHCLDELYFSTQSTSELVYNIYKFASMSIRSLCIPHLELKLLSTGITDILKNDFFPS